jgi:uncharacterized membrane protein
MKFSKGGLFITLLWYALICAGLIVRMAVASNGEPFWYDESFSVVLARLPLDRLIQATAGDVHPPLYYIMLHFFLDESLKIPVEIQARTLSCFLGLLSVIMYMSLIERLGLTETEQSIAVALAMWLPGLLFFSAEARMYALLGTLVMGSLECLWRFPNRFMAVEIGRHVLGGVFIGLACLTHNIGLIYAPVIAVSALVYRLRRGDIPMRATSLLLICAGVALIVYAPWISTFISQLRATSIDGYWLQKPGMGSVAYNLYMALCYGLTASKIASVAMIIVAGITTISFVLMARHAPECLIMIGGVVVLMIILSYATGNGVMLHRSMVPLGFMIIVGWVMVISRQKATLIPIVLICMVAASLFLTDGRYDSRYDVWDSLPTREDDIIYANNSAATPLLIYTDLPVYVAYQDHPMAVGLSQKTLEAIGTPMVRIEDLEWTRAWFFFGDVPYTTDSERLYRRKIIDRYHGELFWSNHDPFYENEIWLLQNGSLIQE